MMEGVIFVCKQKTAYESEYGLVGSEMCIRDRCQPAYVNRSKRIVVAPGGEWEKIDPVNHAAQGAAPGAAAPSH